MGITRIGGPQRLLPPFECEHLERAWTPIMHGWLKISSALGYPHLRLGGP